MNEATMKQIRLKNKLSQKGMADYLGLDRTSVTKMESGARTPTTLWVLVYRYIDKFGLLKGDK